MPDPCAKPNASIRHPSASAALRVAGACPSCLGAKTGSRCGKDGSSAAGPHTGTDSDSCLGPRGQFPVINQPDGPQSEN